VLLPGQRLRAPKKRQQTVAESLREFLDRRERELLIELAPAENQVLAIRAELTEIRRAKDSLEAPANNPLAEALRGSGGLDPTSPDNTMPPNFGRLAATEISDSAALAAAPRPFGFGGLAGVPLPLRQERLSIKQMILMALEQEVKFRRHGATASEIRESIKNEFGREVDGTSLSPQLSRLRADGYVDVHENRWKLTNPRALANNPNFVGRQMSSALHDHMNEAPSGDDPDSAPESPDVGK
jgi:hypothetical protein